MTPPRPIEIVGGGLAGLSLGIALRRAGVPVTLHEAGDYPRHRVCGEFITGLGAQTIAALDLGDALAGAESHRDVAWHVGNRPTATHRLPSPALGLSRHVLDARLARRFVALGGELRTGSRRSIPADSAGIVWANGRRRAMRSPWLGLKVHVHDLPLRSGLELHLGARCYVGLTRIEAGAVNVCGLFARAALRQRGSGLLLSYLEHAGLETLAQRLAAARIDEASFCAVAAIGFDRRVPAARAMQIGDANAMVPPFTGNGMAMAFQSAEAALPSLVAYAFGGMEWPAAHLAVQIALQRKFRVRLATAGALHPFLLERPRQRWLAALSRRRLLPFRALYAALH